MRTRETLLIVDLSNQAYKCTATNLGLTSGQTFTGGLYGFLVGLQMTIRETGATRLIIGCDTKPYVRSMDFAGYKADRKKEQNEEMTHGYKQTLRLIDELCAALRIPQWRIAGYEYDDLVGHVVLKYRCRFENIVAMSSDSDLYQLFTAPNFCMHKGKKGFYYLKDFLKDWDGINPRDLPWALALIGTHNAVPGVRGIGPKTAIKAIKSELGMDQLSEKYKHTLRRNLSLIQLPHPRFPFSTQLPPKITMRDVARSLYKFCGRYDIEVTQNMVTAFEQVLLDG